MLQQDARELRSYTPLTETFFAGVLEELKMRVAATEDQQAKLGTKMQTLEEKVADIKISEASIDVLKAQMVMVNAVIAKMEIKLKKHQQMSGFESRADGGLPQPA